MANCAVRRFLSIQKPFQRNFLQQKSSRWRGAITVKLYLLCIFFFCKDVKLQFVKFYLKIDDNCHYYKC